MLTVLRWLSGEPIRVDGKVYIFPHGAPLIRRMIAAHTNTGSKGEVD